MAFALNGTHVEGGTFNNVSGNMSQVFNSHVVNVGQVSAHEVGEDHRLVEGGKDFSAIDGSIGPIRSQRGLRNQDTWPYAMPDPRNRQGHQRREASQAHTRGDGSRNPQIIYSATEYVASADPQTKVTLYSRQFYHAPGNEANSTPAPATAGHTNDEGQSFAAMPSSHFQSPLQNYNTSPAFRMPSGNISTTFNSVGGDMTQLTVTSYGESGIDLLYHYVAMEALHNSGERFPEPACHPETRTAMLEGLESWATDTSPESRILWVHGCAGVGKSAIAQMFSGKCQTKGRLGASFFFQHGHAKRGTWHSLINTIAYQLATSVPELLLPIQQAVEHDKLVVGRALAVSFQQLLVEPFQNVQHLQRTPVIVLDGLDECADNKVQQQILRLFIGSIRNHNLPIRLLIASRPEPHLREVFETVETLSICCQSSLSADLSADNDIRRYFGDEFSRIHSEALTRGVNLGPTWPSPDTMNHLVTMASGTFIYATTVIRFVDDEYHHPSDRLESVLKLDPRSTASLDDLYTGILSTASEEQETDQLRILHTISRGEWDPEEIDKLLNLRHGTCRMILRRLHSLLNVPPIRTQFGCWRPISIFHASFEDYLSDARRSGRWCVSLAWLPPDSLHCMLHLLSTPPQTDSQRHLYGDVVYRLPDLLGNATPSDALIDLLRHPNVQKYLYLGENKYSWPGIRPKKDSPYPSDLVRLWEDHGAISRLLHCLILSEHRSIGTFKYDSIYTEIFSQNPNLLVVTQCGIVNVRHPNSHLDLFGWTAEIFRPLLKFPQLCRLPFPDGDSPLDFLTDPCRAGKLYSEPCHIAEEMVLRWIGRAKRVLAGGPWDMYLDYLELIERCQPSGTLLRELEMFDLSEFCHQMAMDPEAHSHFHGSPANERTLCAVLKWLQSFPDPSPRQVIEFWERQINDIRRCSFHDTE